MNQRCSVLGLIISVLVSAENALTVLDNVLQSKPMNANSAEHSIVKMKTIFLNNGFAKIDPNVHNNNGDKKLHAFDVSKTNNVVGTKSATRFSRQARKSSHNKNNNEDTSGQHIKLLLDLQSENQKDVYDYYDYYDDYRGKNVLIDDCKLNTEMENNSKPVTRTLSESQERKRCTTLLAQSSGAANNRQQKSQESRENVEDERSKAVLSCRDCQLLTSSNNNNSVEPVSSFNSRINEMDDEYLIVVLKQLIDRLHKPDKSKSILYEDVTVQRSSSEPTTPVPAVDGSVVGTKNANGSSEEEWILKLEKIKGNRIMDGHESSLENIFVNGKWIKNKITKNLQTDDCGKPTVDNDLRSGLNESVFQNGDVKPPVAPLDLKSPDNRVTAVTADGDDNTSKNHLPVVVTQENREFTAAEESLFGSGGTVSPVVSLHASSTRPAKEKQDTTENNEVRVNTAADKDNFERPTAVSNYNRTTSIPVSANEEWTSENALRIKDPDDISESNGDADDNGPKTNSSEAPAAAAAAISSSAEKENGLPDNEASSSNCDCSDRKVVKNVLSSITIKNVTEINTDTYNGAASPDGRTKSHRRPDRRSQRNNDNNSKNASAGETAAVALKNGGTNDLENDRSKTRQRTTGTSHESDDDAVRKSISIDRDGAQRSRNGERDNGRKTAKTGGGGGGGAIPDFNGQRSGSESRRKNGPHEENARNDADGKKKSYSIRGGSSRLVEKSRQRTNDTGHVVRNDSGRHGGADGTAKRISGTAKTTVDRNSVRRNNTPAAEKPRQRTAAGAAAVVHYGRDNGVKTNRRIIITARPDVAPTGRSAQTARRFGGGYDADGVTEKANFKPESRTRVTTESVADDKRRPGKHWADDGGDGKSPGEFTTTQSERRYAGADKSLERNFETARFSRKNGGFGKSDSRKPPVRSNSNKPRTIPAENTRHADAVRYYYPRTAGINERKNGNVLRTPKPTGPVKTAAASRRIRLMAVNDDETKPNKSFDDAKRGVNDGRRVRADRTATITITPTTTTTTSAAVGYYYDLLEKPSSKNNTRNGGRSSSAADFVADSAGKSNLRPESGSGPELSPKSLQTKRKGGDYDDEHAPYTAEDLRPIVFREPTRKLPPASIPTEPAPSLVTAEDRNGAIDDRRVSDHAKRARGKPSSTFRVLPRMKVVEGVFNVPLVGRVGHDGSVSDVFIPIDKSDGARHSAISLAKLLSGRFRLSNGRSRSAAADSEPVRDLNAVPVHIIQIINNGMCSSDARNCSSTAAAESEKRSDDDDGEDTARSRNTPISRRQISAELKNARYGHFDPEIVDRFLQVYATPYTV